MEEAYEVKTASTRPGKLQRLLEMLSLVFRNRKTADYVLIDTYSTQNFWYAVAVGMLCRRLGLKYIPILHGGELPKRLKNSSRVAHQLFQKAYINIAPSKYLKAVFESHGILNTVYIPNSIHIINYPFKQSKQLKPSLLWVRSFAQVYNPLMALHVLEILLMKYPDAELCMVGPEKDASMAVCKRMAEKKKLPVRFTGRLQKQHWIKLAAQFDVFLNTTNVDNTPVSVIEAMALGLPVISTDVGGIPFLIDNESDGLLVSPMDAVKMASAVDELISHPQRAFQLAAAAREKAESFDWLEVKPLWLNLLK